LTGVRQQISHGGGGANAREEDTKITKTTKITKKEARFRIKIPESQFLPSLLPFFFVSFVIFVVFVSSSPC
jgi:ABC-type Na+ efflux pump permease subunit